MLILINIFEPKNDIIGEKGNTNEINNGETNNSKERREKKDFLEGSFKNFKLCFESTKLRKLKIINRVRVIKKRLLALRLEGSIQVNFAFFDDKNGKQINKKDGKAHKHRGEEVPAIEIDRTVRIAKDFDQIRPNEGGKARSGEMEDLGE